MAGSRACRNAERVCRPLSCKLASWHAGDRCGVRNDPLPLLSLWPRRDAGAGRQGGRVPEVRAAAISMRACGAFRLGGACASSQPSWSSCRSHDEIWPEMASMLKDHGVHNYSISLLPSTRQLFAYVEVSCVASRRAEGGEPSAPPSLTCPACLTSPRLACVVGGLPAGWRGGADRGRSAVGCDCEHGSLPAVVGGDGAADGHAGGPPRRDGAQGGLLPAVMVMMPALRA